LGTGRHSYARSPGFQPTAGRSRLWIYGFAAIRPTADRVDSPIEPLSQPAQPDRQLAPFAPFEPC